MSYDRFGKDSAGRRKTPEIEAGNLRNLVTFRRDVGTRSTSGQHIVDFYGAGSVVTQDWVQVLAPHADEPERAGAVSERTVTIMRMRFRDDITPQMVIEHEGRLLNILSVRDASGRRQSLQLECREAKRPAVT